MSREPESLPFGLSDGEQEELDVLQQMDPDRISPEQLERLRTLQRKFMTPDEQQKQAEDDAYAERGGVRDTTDSSKAAARRRQGVYRIDRHRSGIERKEGSQG